jgi:hypothetical protein
MSTLQAGLAILGAVLLAVLAGHALWRARRATLPPSLAPKSGEPAPQPEWREPHLGAPVTVVERGGGEFTTVELAVPEVEPSEPALPVPRRMAATRIDGLLDAIAAISVDSPVAGEAAIAHLPATRRAGSKPLLIEGLDAETGTWETPQAGRRYGEFQAGVQLANRAGALNEIEFSEFVHKAQAFGDAIGAGVELPDMLDAVARARELDAFAGDHDAQLVMRLACGRAAWTLGYVQQQAQRHGFVPGVVAGRLVLPAAEEGAPPVLVIQFDPQAALADEPHNATLRELRLAFDVPQTAQSEQPFTAWCAAGEALALALDASLLDDSGQPLNPAAFETIAGDLEQLYAALAERDLAAGSAAARRLFS